jgi:hypothetical protein
MNPQEELIGCLLHLTHVLASNHKSRLSIVRADEQPPVVSRPFAVQCGSGGADCRRGEDSIPAALDSRSSLARSDPGVIGKSGRHERA